MDEYTKKSYPFVYTKRQMESLFPSEDLHYENEIITVTVLGVHTQYRNRMYMQLGGNYFNLCSSSTPVGPYLGELMTFLADFFEENQGGGFVLGQLQHKYFRLVLQGAAIVGFGHIIKDQFVLLEDVFGCDSKLWIKDGD